MEKKKNLKETLRKLWEAIVPAMSYRAKPGCPSCITPVMDENGIPIVPHCSVTQKEE